VIYNRAQIAAAWVEAGGDPACSALAAAVALAESNGHTDSVAADNRSGLWMAPNPTGTHTLLDPVEAAREAIKRSGNGQYWNHFPAYTNGAYLGFMSPAARIPISPPRNPVIWSAHFRVNSRCIQVEIRRHSEGVRAVILAGRAPLYPEK
jgi:hypothetical protein